MRLRFCPPWIVAGPALLLLMTPPSAFGQTGTGVTCVPVSERAGRAFGCFILATQAIGPLDSGRAFWHLSTFASRSAAEAVAGSHGGVVEALGKVWLLTIAEARWRPSQGISGNRSAGTTDGAYGDWHRGASRFGAGPSRLRAAGHQSRVRLEPERPLQGVISWRSAARQPVPNTRWKMAARIN